MEKMLTFRSFVLIFTDRIMNYSILVAAILVPLWALDMMGVL